jgi:hypothetical protein
MYFRIKFRDVSLNGKETKESKQKYNGGGTTTLNFRFGFWEGPMKSKDKIQKGRRNDDFGF